MRKLSSILKINGEAIYDPDIGVKVDIDSLVGEGSVELMTV